MSSIRESNIHPVHSARPNCAVGRRGEGGGGELDERECVREKRCVRERQAGPLSLALSLGLSGSRAIGVPLLSRLVVRFGGQG